MDVRTALRYEVEAYNRLTGTEDRVEGTLAWNEKRKPIFKGRWALSLTYIIEPDIHCTIFLF